MAALKKISDLEAEIQELEKQLDMKKIELKHEKLKAEGIIQNSQSSEMYGSLFVKGDIEKYCRQMILNNFGPTCQLKIRKAKILIVGAGGLGCPAALYLAAAGVGLLGIIDFDKVSVSNLHRQVLYGEGDLGQIKSEVACRKLSLMHSNVKCIPITEKLTPDNCEPIFKDYDIILDCTDNVATRYLVNDVSVLLKKPLVMGNCIKIEGQLMVCIPGITPCYRCLFPSPPAPSCMGSCNQDGVLGPVPGIIGALQALEAIKIACENFDLDSYKKMVLFDGEQLKFRNINVRRVSEECTVCNPNGIALSDLPNYEDLFGLKAQEDQESYPPKVVISEKDRIKIEDFAEVVKADKSALVIDVRSSIEFTMCRLPNSTNVPLKDLFSKKHSIYSDLDKKKSDSKPEVYVLCRRGNDSQIAVEYLKNMVQYSKLKFLDVAGGLYAWNEKIDSAFPLY